MMYNGVNLYDIVLPRRVAEINNTVSHILMRILILLIMINLTRIVMSLFVKNKATLNNLDKFIVYATVIIITIVYFILT